MNVLFTTQGRTLRLFHNLAKHLTDIGKIERAGFYVTDAKFYENYISAQPELEADFPAILKEWDILEAAHKTPADLAKLREIEKRLGDPTLWHAIVADRRLYFGPRAMREQDYISRYSHDALMAITQQCATEMEALFDRVKPDFVVGFICVTMGEYMAELIAKARGIPFINLRPTRIRNYFYGGESVHEPSHWLEEVYQRFNTSEIPAEYKKPAQAAIAEVQTAHALYEGVIPLAAQQGKAAAPKPVSPGKQPRRTGRVSGICRDIWNFKFGKYRFDNHYEGHFAPHWFRRIKRPLRRWQSNLVLKDDYISKTQELEKLEYAFYPMHKEPEVTLLVYGRSFLNQIEIIRNLAHSLPLGMKLVVKEHPMSVGYRATAYYQKILAIPNVILADPALTSRDLLTNAKLVSIIGGSIGLEAMMRKIPVIVFGNVPFSFLPDSMIQTIGNPAALAAQINDLLQNHQHDENAILAYVAAVIQSSVAVDFYSVLIGRQGGWRPTENENSSYQTQLAQLAHYILARAAQAS